MSELHDLPALALRDALARGEVSAREVTEHFLRRIDALNPGLSSFVTVTHDDALRAADHADRLLASGVAVGPLHGMPLAHKDLTDVAGVRTTLGTAALEPAVAQKDAPLASVLRRSGAISLGKTQVPEFGLSCYSENRIAPPARNPLDPRLSPAGSSGGSAAAVAARMIPFAPGTDGGGSVRIPAAATGLVGLKPNRGRVPSGSGQADLGQFVVAGPLAHSAADAGLLLDALVREPNYRPTSAASRYPGSYVDAALRGEGRFRIGVSTVSPFSGAEEFAGGLDLDSAAVDSFHAGIRLLQGAGHDVVDADLTYDSRYHEAFQLVWTAGLATAAFPPEREERLMDITRVLRRRALGRSTADLAGAVDVLRQFEYDTIRQYARYDMILTPAVAMTPRPIGWYTDADGDTDYLRQCRYSPYTSMVNVCGLPAVTVPTLRLPDGLSMSVQLIGRPGEEAQLLAVSAQIEALRQ
ncbi:amidase [Arthrobacter agilis]|uniref:amidase n=1 Tax=Arthrobacter agilis TaxID=37921 RepID=UPI000B364589|nr:amidase [Arthrobacter agilis]OUM42368.1 amidase [Arthrobacter agilis]PPB45710.1 amidase [Arthrobacter agilis]TPV26309.1 amidase [Arthrobacter agilis]VDR30835.1 Glutamyl-tRNA(Gln) amidotransferase subunit A [Arthrobacter agilis]